MGFSRLRDWMITTWFVMSLAIIGVVAAYFGLGGTGFLGPRVLDTFFPVGMGCLALTLFFSYQGTRIPINWVSINSVFFGVTILDFVVMKYVVHVVGFFVFHIYYLQGIAIFVGWIILGKRVFWKGEKQK